MEEWKEYKASPWGIIPIHWKISSIKEETDVVTDYVANGSFASLAENVKYKSEKDYAVLIRLVDYNNQFKGDFVYIDKNAYEFLGKSKLYGDEIIISNVGANVGTVFRCPHLECKMSLAPNSIMVKFNGNNDFYYYWLKSRFGQHMLKSIVTGSAQPKFNKTNFRDLQIPVPPLDEQESIASILKSLDDKIEVNRRINDNLEQQAQALFKSWFVDFEPFKNGEFVESELGMIPKGWRVGTLDEIIKEAESGSRPKGGAETDGVPSIGAEKIERFGVYDYSSEKYINNNYYVQMKRGHVKEGDVLLYKDGAYTGKSSMALDGFPYKECAVNEHVFLLRTEASRFQFYLYFLISYPDIKTMIHILASAKAAQPGLNQKELLGLDITIPNEEIIKQFNDLISPYMHQIANNAKESRCLAELRDTLIPKLMSGELKVNEIA